MPTGIFIALFGYLLGSVPFGLILAKLFSSVDPRREGSRNIGATNIFRTAGKTLGILTLVADALKGAIPIWIATQWNLAPHWIALAGLGPCLGHVFPIFLGFKGGKGVATALGVYLVISPVAVLIEFFLFSALVWKWRFISVGSMVSAMTMPILIAFFRSDSLAYIVLSLLIAALILYRHQSNLSRLLEGTEHRWKA
ncbi:MAG: glycerol-3-phosphate 1-O-acyltransferase PlsY [Syntrophaceae bacterium]|nr:glycerol-3-phosphate 1-O-acyltransferase PlsY [Syntrophaceae bacterium]